MELSAGHGKCQLETLVPVSFRRVSVYEFDRTWREREEISMSSFGGFINKETTHALTELTLDVAAPALELITTYKHLVCQSKKCLRSTAALCQ